MIEFHLSIRLPRHNKRSLLKAFEFVAAWARAERGCLGVDLYWTTADSNRLSYVEKWKSEDELRAMLRSRHFSQLIALSELALELISCEFKIIHEIRGLGFAAEVLGETALPQSTESELRKNP